MFYKQFPSDVRDIRGFTLLEILVTVVVIGIAATAIMGVYINTVRESANPLIQQQAIAIAEAYLEEIQLKNFADPDQPETGTEEASRNLYDDIQDYNGLTDNGAEDQNGNAIVSLAAYTVQVAVTSRVMSGPDTVPAVDSRRIDVTVSHAAISPITLSGFRANY